MSMELLEAAVRRSKFTPFPVRAAVGAVTREEFAAAQERIAILEAKLSELVKLPPEPPPGIPRLPAIEDIKREIRGTYGVEEAELIGACRRQWITHARQIAMYLCCKHTPNSMPGIARRFGDRDHSTVYNARDRITKRMQHDDKLRGEVLFLEKRLGLA